jgi:arabinose-5-phosphate isomerase
MGKSGHIGRKIAATFSATGTPAIFIHPAEAAHGDLGMLVPGDLLLVLSNSGNTSELRSVMTYARAQGCKIIGVASRPKSEVMRGSDVRIVMPDVREACPLNIAPTSSSTAMLALGDALAVAVMGIRGISRSHMQLLHPGGNIGLKALPVEEAMHTGDALPLVHLGEPMRNVIVVMNEKCLGTAGVVDDDGNLIGVITDGDLRRNIDRILSVCAGDIMSRDPKTIAEGTTVEEAMAIFSQRKISALFVMDRASPRRPSGVLHIHDLTRLGVA